MSFFSPAYLCLLFPPPLLFFSSLLLSILAGCCTENGVCCVVFTVTCSHLRLLDRHIRFQQATSAVIHITAWDDQRDANYFSNLASLKIKHKITMVSGDHTCVLLTSPAGGRELSQCSTPLAYGPTLLVAQWPTVLY